MNTDNSNQNQAGYRCDLCDKPMLERNCKLICINCGYTRDCTDP